MSARHERALHEGLDAFVEIIATRVAEIVLAEMRGGRPSKLSKRKGLGEHLDPWAAQKEKVDAVLRDVRAGAPVAVIAARWQLGVSTVYRYIEKHGRAQAAAANGRSATSKRMKAPSRRAMRRK